MARSDLVKRMMESYQRGDDAGFRSAAADVIAEERKKRHDLLANELETILSFQSTQKRPLQVAALKPLPKSRDDLPLLRLENPRLTLDDLVLKPASRALLLDVVREFRSGAVLQAHGLRPRSRLLFVGPPGCGKTVTAEAIASELGFALARVNLATVVSSFLGETSRNLESIFSFAETGSWVLVFDEFDALAKERADASEHGELKRVVTAFLQLLDGFSGDTMVIAASNHPALLDSAVWRRFDEVVRFDLPSTEDIARLLHLKLASTRIRFPLEVAASRMTGMTHAEVETVCLDALRHSIVDGRTEVEWADYEVGLARMEERREAVRPVEMHER